MKRLTFLDTDAAMEYCCNDEDFYRELLETYIESSKLEDLKEKYRKEDWENYRITVHALKSTSLAIGARELSEQAKKLEMAAKEGDTAYIAKHHAAVMQQYEQMLGKIRKALEDEGSMQDEKSMGSGKIEVDGACILVVDDDDMNLRIAGRMLGGKFRVLEAHSGKEAFAVLEQQMPDMILLDVHMPEMDGHSVIRQLKASEKYKNIPVIFLTADNDGETEVQGFDEGALDFITKPFRQDIVLQRISRILELDYLQKNLQSEVEKQTRNAEERRKKVEQMSFQMVQTLANAIDAKDKYTNGHSTRVSEYAVLLAKELGWQNETLDYLRYAALLHDIGKIGIPDSILNKPSRLTDMEYEVIKSHTVMGMDILKTVTTIPGAENVAGHHHERYDGKGYPDGLKGEEIPIEARIVGIADAYDAMNSRRIYRKSLSSEIIRSELVKGRGTQFDPELLDVFLKLFDENRIIIVEEKSERDPILEESGRLLQKVMETMSTQKKNEDKDFLTELPMRKEGEMCISQAMQEGRGCLAFIDVDNLKKINDTMGHLAGDYVLKEVGGLLKEKKESSIACRLGGDEFLYFMKENNATDATEHIKTIFKHFEDKREKSSLMRKASLSAGLCMCETSDQYHDVYNKADKALYHVKQNGKAGFYFYQHENRYPTRSAEVDLNKLLLGLTNSGSYEGALDLEYREFAKLFEYMRNLERRYHHDFHIAMITLDSPERGELFIDQLENAMNCMEHAIQSAIRNVDICTRYSSVQFLVILFEVGEDNIQKVINRIFQDFYKIYGNSQISLSYAVARMNGSTEEQ